MKVDQPGGHIGRGGRAGHLETPPHPHGRMEEWREGPAYVSSMKRDLCIYKFF
jgi:hypothetical protein